MKVADVMTRTVISVTPDTTVRECIKLLRENKISGVPVVAGRNIVGIITENDVSRSSRYPNTQESLPDPRDHRGSGARNYRAPRTERLDERRRGRVDG